MPVRSMLLVFPLLGATLPLPSSAVPARDHKNSLRFLDFQAGASAPAAAPAAVAENADVNKILEFAGTLAASTKAEVSNAGNDLVTGLDARIASAQDQTVASYEAASARQSQRLLEEARAQFEELSQHRMVLRNAVQVATLKAGFDAAKNATAAETQRRLNGRLLNESAHKLFKAMQDMERAWDAAKNRTKLAASRAMGQWTSSSTMLDNTWGAVDQGLSSLNDAGEAVNRAGRAVRWDGEASHASASLSEEAYEAALDTDTRINLAREQAIKAARVNDWETSGVLNTLGTAVAAAEQQADEIVAGNLVVR